MVRTAVGSLVLVALTAAACSKDVAAPVASEPVLAQQAQVIAQEVATSTGTTHEIWLQHLLDVLRHTDDPEAQACLAEARDLHHQAVAAHDAGDIELARQLAHDAFLKVLCAVVEVFPDAPERTGIAADEAIARIEHLLAGHDAPHIREVLAHVKELRAQADGLLAEGSKVEALALNLRAIQILHGLAGHLGEHHDHDGVADSEMLAVSY